MAILRFCWPANRSRSDFAAQENGTSKRLRMSTFAARRLEVPVGIAPTHGGFADPCLTTWLRHQKTRSEERAVSNTIQETIFSHYSLLSAHSSLTGSSSVNPSKIASTCCSSASSIATGVVAVIVYPF